jgi:hypothetical protein
MTRTPWAGALVSILALASASANAVTSNDDLARLANMSLEQLMSTRVTSVAGRPESRFATPAALTVLTAEDIRRNGFRSVPEALRMVPGMFVGQVNSSSWVIGARGLTGSSLTATRYLVLIDGRLVYDPLLSTTFWDVVDVPLADVDRIEVVRGPGSTLWGVNAMNGVVNIITKKVADTLGTLVEVGAGSNAESTVTLRHGAALDADTAFNAWVKYDRHGDFETAAGIRSRISGHRCTAASASTATSPMPRPTPCRATPTRTRPRTNPCCCPCPAPTGSSSALRRTTPSMAAASCSARCMDLARTAVGSCAPTPPAPSATPRASACAGIPPTSNIAIGCP